MEFRVSYPYQAIPSEQKFKGHSLCSDEGLVYIGTHFEHDVYVQTKGLEAGHIYCVYGKKVVDEREEPSRGETQRHIQLLVRAAVLAHGGAPTFPDNTPDQTMSVSVPEASKGSPDETL